MRNWGVRQATVIEIEIKWQGSGTVQRFKNVKVNQNLKLIEGKDVPVLIPLKQFVFKNKKHQEIPMCVPQKTI